MLKMKENGTGIFENETVNVSVSFPPILLVSPQGTQMKADSEFMSKNTNGLHGSCPTCGGPICEHDYCINNRCGQDYECPNCADREWREIEAEDNAKYYEGNFE